MKLPPLKEIYQYIEIPRVFYSDATGKPFSHCIDCEKYLLADGVQYFIEKAIKNYSDYQTSDTIIEYAMCIDCYARVFNSFSDTSKKNLEKYFTSHVDIFERRMALLKNRDLNVDNWIANCVIKNKPANELSEYQIVCQCDGKDLLFTYSPFMVSDLAIEEMMELLSNKTLGEIEDFMDDFFSYPPEVRDILKGSPVFVL